MQDTTKQSLLSVVLPAYNEEASVPRAAQVICSLLAEANILRATPSMRLCLLSIPF